MLCFSGFELNSRWVPLTTNYCIFLLIKFKSSDPRVEPPLALQLFLTLPRLRTSSKSHAKLRRYD